MFLTGLQFVAMVGPSSLFRDRLSHVSLLLPAILHTRNLSRQLSDTVLASNTFFLTINLQMTN